MDELISSALLAATRAPSPNNTQPWLLRVRHDDNGRRIDVLLDRQRILPVADPDGREARISCGAAALNAMVSLRAAGHGVRVDLLPDHAEPDLMASVWIGRPRRPHPGDLALAAAIGRRATNRRPFLDRPVPAHRRTALADAVHTEGAQLVMLNTPGELDALATVLRRADHLQEQDPAFQAELRHWTGRPADDGVPGAAGGPRPIGGVLAMRSYGESTVERQYESDPFVVVVGTHGDGEVYQLIAGQAMQRLLLTATVDGLCASYLSQPIEVPTMRSSLRDLIGGRLSPQTVLRIGYGYPVPPTPRRPVHAVLIGADGSVPVGQS